MHACIRSAAGAAVRGGDAEAVGARHRRRAGHGTVRRQAQACRQAASRHGIAIRRRAARGGDALAEGDAGRHGWQGRRRDADRRYRHRQRIGAHARIWTAARRTVRGPHGEVEGAARRWRASQQTGIRQAHAGRQGTGADRVGVRCQAVRGRQGLAVGRADCCTSYAGLHNRHGRRAHRDAHGGHRRGADAVGGRVGKAVWPAITGRRRICNAGAAGRRRAMRGAGGHAYRGRHTAAQAQGDRGGAAAVGHRGADIAGNGRTRCHAAGIGA
ncbi:hypothetical protein JANLI_04650 [Janthinobacterium lividum]|nr:hypothetical protein JANLI_04650 [Janthinobacterium lividum]